jgi:transcriptional regulator of heat shock response
VNPRSADILRALVREFIVSGEPVSSGWLYEHHDFGIKPAMIRAELSDLTDRGFLEQPHHSAGRAPRDKAYEFFAEFALQEESKNNELSTLFGNHAWEDLAEKLSEELGMMSAIWAAGEQGARHIYKEGLQELVESLDWESRADLTSVIRDFEELDERIERARGMIPDDTVNVFIGRKSPVTSSETLSVMLRNCDVGGEQVLIFAIGPKRMDYEKSAKMFKGLEINDKE